jgi:large conductance mechanosensitive channel
MIKGFKDFLMRGNVVDLAVAVVIGAAFGAVVTSFTEKVIGPLLAAIGGAESPGFGIALTSGAKAGDPTYLDLGAVVTALINFVIVAAVVYFLVVVPMNRLQSRRAKGEEPQPEAPSDEVILLTDIRDALRARD